MINPIIAIIKLLKGRLILNDNIVPVIKRYYPYDNSPCVTFDDSAGGVTYYRRFITLQLPVESNHPQFDSNNPGKLFSQQVLKEKKSSDLRLNIWADTEEDRDIITTQIKQIFNQALSNHYTTCYFYNNGECENNNCTCHAQNNTTGKGIKNQCPKPKEYGYQSTLSYFNIDKTSFQVSPEYNLDDLNITQVGLRTVLPITMDYYIYHRIGGNQTEEITINDFHNGG